MLSLLHIENIAVIESADISFDGGFTVLTGETGAGKSIVIDAISAILGERAYRDMIRTGANKATVRAVFTGVPKLQWFEDNGVEYDPETIVQREIFLDGKNVCRVNGSLVTVSILRKLGIQLINIHGQHDSASLFDEDNHLAFLDAFAGNEALRSDYGEKYETVAKLRREIDRLTMDEGEKLRRMETLKYQIAEIEKAELEPGEDERLEDRRKILQNAEKLSNGMETAVECLYGGDDTDGAAGLLAQAEYALARLSRFSDSFNALHERVADLMYQVQDAAEEVRDARDGLSYSADELEQIESRLDVIHKLRRKYGTTCEDILAYLDSARKELDDIEFADDHLERLKGKLQKAEKAAWDAAIALFQLQLLRGVFTVLCQLYNNYILALGRSRLLVITEALRDGVALAAIVATLPVIALSGPDDVVEGVRIFLWGQVGATFVAWAATLIMTVRVVGSHASCRGFLRDLAPYAVMTLPLMAAMWGLSQVIANVWFLMAAQIAVGVGLYMGANALLGSRIQADAIAYLRGRL